MRKEKFYMEKGEFRYLAWPWPGTRIRLGQMLSVAFLH